MASHGRSRMAATRSARVAGQGVVGPLEGVLGDLLGVGRDAHDPQGQAVDQPLVGDDQLLEGPVQVAGEAGRQLGLWSPSPA